jgi:membrane protein DedA with SNARE-associated domain
MLEYLLDLVARMGHWSYLIIGVAAALECAAFVGLLVPGESIVLASGFFAHEGILSLDSVIAAAGIGAVLGDNLGYQLGCRLGRDWLVRHGRRLGITEQRLGRAERFFARHGPKAVFLGRFVGFARALVPFVAGTSRMPYGRFILYDALGAVLWTVGCATLGYVLGASWRVAEAWIGRVGLGIGALVVIAAIVVWRRRGRARARQATATYSSHPDPSETMSDQKLRRVVEEMRSQLASAEGLPSGTRRSLEQLVHDLEKLAGPEGVHAELSASLRDRASDAVRRLEASHPVLSTTLGNVVDTLAFFGL